MSYVTTRFYLRQLIQTFQYGGSDFFTTVSAYQPELQQMLDLESNVPYCGVELVIDDEVELQPQSDKRDYKFALHVILAMPAGGMDEACEYKDQVLDAFKKFLLLTVNNGLMVKHGGVRIESVDVSGEDLVFQGKWASIEQGTYLASVIQFTVKNVLEDLT